MVGSSGVRRAAVADAGAASDTDVAALGRRVTALETRLAALEAKPEEVAHFTASAKLPAIAVAATTTLTLTGLVPAVAGDRIRKGEAVTAEPATPLPGGANIAAVYVPADDTVAVQITAGLAIALGAAPIAWTVTVLR